MTRRAWPWAVRRVSRIQILRVGLIQDDLGARRFVEGRDHLEDARVDPGARVVVAHGLAAELGGDA